MHHTSFPSVSFCRHRGYRALLAPAVRFSGFHNSSNARSNRILTSTIPQSPHQSSDSSAPVKPPVKPQNRRSLRPLIYGVTFLFLGFTTGQYVRFVAVPPPLPIPASPEDLALTRVLDDDAERLPILQELRSHPDDWTEVNIHKDLQQSSKSSSLIAGAMSGSRGLAVQRVFCNPREHRSISIIFFGGALAGWPGVTHGGAVATILQENLERVAMMYIQAKSSSPTGLAATGGLLESINVKYSKPTLANRFFIIRTEMDEYEGAKSETDVVRVKATVEEIDQGMICAEATGCCRLPV